MPSAGGIAAAAVQMCEDGLPLETFATQYFAVAGSQLATTRSVLEHLASMPSSDAVERATRRLEALGAGTWPKDWHAHGRSSPR